MKQATSLLFAVLLVITVASLALNVYQYSSPRTVTTESTTSCMIAGQPAGIQFRVLSDSTSVPIAGVVVTAVNKPALCNGFPATSQTVDMFTTNATQWLPLSSDNNYQYSFIANYQGHTFTLTATLEPVSLTCATLYVPSGRTNTTTTEFGSGCP